jgi:hypothetical protein
MSAKGFIISDELQAQLDAAPNVTPKTLRGLVKYLRKHGRLDEEKWERARKTQKIIITLCCALPLVLGVSVGGISGVIVICIFVLLYSYECRKVSRYHLYSLGVQHIGKVILKGHSDIIPRKTGFPYRLAYSYSDHLGDEHTCYYNANLLSPNALPFPEIGEEINIVFLKDQPQKSAPLFERFNTEFNFNK